MLAAQGLFREGPSLGFHSEGIQRTDAYTPVTKQYAAHCRAILFMAPTDDRPLLSIKTTPIASTKNSNRAP